VVARGGGFLDGFLAGGSEWISHDASTSMVLRGGGGGLDAPFGAGGGGRRGAPVGDGRAGSGCKERRLAIEPGSITDLHHGLPPPEVS